MKIAIVILYILLALAAFVINGAHRRIEYLNQELILIQTCAEDLKDFKTQAECRETIRKGLKW